MGSPLLSFHLENSEESLLGKFHVADVLHPFLSFLLFLQKFPFAGYVPAVTLGQNVFAHSTDYFPGYDLAPFSQGPSRLASPRCIYVRLKWGLLHHDPQWFVGTMFDESQQTAKSGFG